MQGNSNLKAALGGGVVLERWPRNERRQKNHKKYWEFSRYQSTTYFDVRNQVFQAFSLLPESSQLISCLNVIGAHALKGCERCVSVSLLRGVSEQILWAMVFHISTYTYDRIQSSSAASVNFWTHCTFSMDRPPNKQMMRTHLNRAAALVVLNGLLAGSGNGFGQLF